MIKTVKNKSAIALHHFNSISVTGIEMANNNKRITYGMIDGKRAWFLEAIVGGYMQSSQTFSSLSKLIRSI